MARHEGPNLTGRNLKNMRLKAGLSRDLFAKMCNEHGLKISEAQIRDIEDNIRMVYDYELEKFSEVLDIPMDNFFDL